MMHATQPSTPVLSVSELALRIKSNSKRHRMNTLVQFLMEHKGSFVSKRRMSALLSVTDRSLYRYLGELKTLVPIESKSGMYGLANVA